MEQQEYLHLLPIGSLLKQGEYRIVRYIASGGFGNTYEVEHTRLGKHLALKEFFMRGINHREGTRVTVSLSENNGTFRQMREKFLNEALRLARMENPYVVEVTDYFEDNDTAYYAMKLIEGESLAATMKRTGHAFSEEQVRQVLPQVLAALKSVHACDIYHLDLKPANIMQDAEGHCWLIDFGASKQLSATESRTLSTSTGLCYTPGYAPSEQVEGSTKRIGPWTDFYALGATLYNMLTNTMPPELSDVKYDGEQAFHFPPNVSQQMRQLVFWLMRSDYPQRPQSVDEIMARWQEPTPRANIRTNNAQSQYSNAGSASTVVRKSVETVKASTARESFETVKAQTGHNNIKTNKETPQGSKKKDTVSTLGAICVIVFVYSLISFLFPRKVTMFGGTINSDFLSIYSGNADDYETIWMIVAAVSLFLSWLLMRIGK